MDEYAPQQRQAFAQLFLQANRQLMGFFHTQLMPDTAVEGDAQAVHRQGVGMVAVGAAQQGLATNGLLYFLPGQLCHGCLGRSSFFLDVSPLFRIDVGDDPGLRQGRMQRLFKGTDPFVRLAEGFLSRHFHMDLHKRPRPAAQDLDIMDGQPLDGGHPLHHSKGIFLLAGTHRLHVDRDIRAGQDGIHSKFGIMGDLVPFTDAYGRVDPTVRSTK